MQHLFASVVLSVVAAVSGQSEYVYQIRLFRPTGYNHTVALDDGRGPDPSTVTVELAGSSFGSEWCDVEFDTPQDVLSVGLPTPVVGDFSPEDFAVLVCQTAEVSNGSSTEWQVTDSCEPVVPTCAHMPLEDTPNQRRTILLYGTYLTLRDNFATAVPTHIMFQSMKFLVDGVQVAVYGEGEPSYAYGRVEVPIEPIPPGPYVGFYSRPLVVDIAIQNLTAPSNTAAADPNGCAALHPSATYAIRVFFPRALVAAQAQHAAWLSTHVHDSAGAAAFFSLGLGANGSEPSPDEVVGVAGAPGGAAVDACVRSATPQPQVDAVLLSCSRHANWQDRIPTWGGLLCLYPVKAFLQSEADHLAGLDRATYATDHTVEFCLSSSGGCPGDPAPGGNLSAVADHRGGTSAAAAVAGATAALLAPMCAVAFVLIA